MLPQLTLQSMALLPAASCARVLIIRVSPGRRSTMNTLLLVGPPRPRPVIWVLPGHSPCSGTPIRWRSNSSTSASSRGSASRARISRWRCRHGRGTRGIQGWQQAWADQAWRAPPGWANGTAPCRTGNGRQRSMINRRGRSRGLSLGDPGSPDCASCPGPISTWVLARVLQACSPKRPGRPHGAFLTGPFD